jgi:hypothetical protein
MLLNDMRREMFRSRGQETEEIAAVRLRATSIKQQLPLAQPAPVITQLFDERPATTDCSESPRASATPSLELDVMEDCSHARWTKKTPAIAPVSASRAGAAASIPGAASSAPVPGKEWATWPPREVALPVFMRHQLELLKSDHAPDTGVAFPKRPWRNGPGLTGGGAPLGRAA